MKKYFIALQWQCQIESIVFQSELPPELAIQEGVAILADRFADNRAGIIAFNRVD